jgi:hypothetical protein
MSDLQSEYLEMLGITLWEKQAIKEHKHEQVSGYHVVINEPGITRYDMLANEKKTLLEKMIAAMNWPLSSMQYHFIQKPQEPALQFGKGDQWAYLPSLDELMEDRTAKQRAWLLMQALNI